MWLSENSNYVCDHHVWFIYNSAGQPWVLSGWLSPGVGVRGQGSTLVPGLGFAQKLFHQFTQERDTRELIHANERCNRKHQSINLSVMAKGSDRYLLVGANVPRPLT